jgi:molybdopterin-synthase adenylyltransferase
MDENLERYSRQMLFECIGRAGQEKLLGSRVAIAGCGALGTGIADKLARAGIGYLRLIDRDFVELNNLQRQVLFTEEHVNGRMPKAVAAAEALGQINSSIVIEPVVGDIEPSSVERLLEGIDLVMDGTDNIETRLLVNDACVKAGVPWVHGAALGSCGQEMAIIPRKTACYRCYLPELPDAPLEGCEVHGILNTVTGIVSAIESTHALKILTGDVEFPSVMTFVDVWEGEVRQFVVDRNPECPACGKGEYQFLDRRATSWTGALCGRNAVQITPAAPMDIDLEELSKSLRKAGKVTTNGYLLTLSVDDYELIVFPTGRVMVKGTTDPSVARSLASRYVGM